MFTVQEELENGNPVGDGKKTYEPEDYSGSDSEEDDGRYGARRRKPDKPSNRGAK